MTIETLQTGLENRRNKAAADNERNWLSEAVATIRQIRTHFNVATRPIPDAADGVTEVAKKLSAMLDQLQAGLIWQMLILPPKPKA